MPRLVIVVAVVVMMGGVARGDVAKKCKDPAHYVFTQTQGCIKRPPARQKTPQESYVNGLDAVEADPKRAFALFEAACTAKFAPACVQLGLLYQSGRGRAVAKDRDKANALFERGCELGDGVACQKRASAALDTHEPEVARGWFDKGCAKDDGVACGYLALMLDHGYGGDKNPADAKAKYEKANRVMQCPGNGMACYMRGYFLDEGLGVTADPAAALAAYRQACNESWASGCVDAAKKLDRAKADPKAAIELYVKACELENADACTTAAGRLSDLDPKATYPVELAERGCNLNSRECGTLGHMYRLGRGMPQPDQQKATQIFKSACDAGDHWVCVTYAQRLHDGIGTADAKPDLATAVAILEGACKAEEGAACAKASEWAIAKKTEDAKAFQLADRACTLKHPRGCYLAAWLVRRERRGGGLGGDPKKDALAIALKGCELKSGSACNEAGELQGELGDQAAAVASFRAGCDASEDQTGDSCQALAVYLANGKAGAKDLKGAHAAAIKLCPLDESRCPWVAGTTEDPADIKLALDELMPLCERGHQAVCHALGLTLQKGTLDDKARAFALFGAGCKAKHAPACLAEGDALRTGTGTGAGPDLAKADALFGKLCDDRDAEGCFQVAFDHRDTDGKVALEYGDRACTLGHAEGCNLAGFLHYTAKHPIPWDITAAFRYYTKACDLGSSSACGNLGEVYRFGLGAPPDPAKAHALYKKSCEAESQYGCAGYAHYLATGEGGATRDGKRAETLWRASCEAESIEACSELATLLETQHGSAQEISRLRLRAFSLAEKQAPTNPEYMYWLGTFYRDGVATMKQPAKALELFGKACDSFDPFGCLAAGHQLLASHTAEDRERAHLYFQRACAAGVEDGCAGLKEAEGAHAGAGSATPPQAIHPRGGCCHGEVAPGSGAGAGVLAAAVALALARRRRPV